MAMELLLRKNVSGLGGVGEVVKVSSGYGRNFLLPRRLAVTVSDANRKAIEAEGRQQVEAEASHVKELQAAAERIQASDITLHERVSGGDNLYGAISTAEILAALKEEDIEIAPAALLIDEPIKTLGVHRVKVRLHNEVEAELKIWVVEKKEVASEN